jgi:TBC1 domain family protein 5
VDRVVCINGVAQDDPAGRGTDVRTLHALCCVCINSFLSFPDMSYFRDPDIQLQLTNILFLYSTCHPAIGYRQGMHELLAPLFYAVNWDSIPADSTDGDPGVSTLRELCSSTWIAADSWILFEAVMRSVGPWYEWQDPNPKSEGQPDAKLYVTPIVQACNRIQSTLLRNVDPLLHKSLHKTGIEPQIYGMYAAANALFSFLD